jgi:tape measure domain-containing protein
MATARSDLKFTVGADMSQFSATMRRVGASAQATSAKVGRAFQSSAKAIGQLTLTATKAGVAIGGIAASAALFKGVKLAADMESTAVAFKTLTGSAETANQVLDDLRKLGAETPFEFPELADAGRKLIAFGEGADTVAETLRRVGDVSSGVQAPIGEIAELYGKARVQGRLFGEDINQLTGRGIPIIGELAKQFGVTESEVKKLVEQGKVGFPNLEKAFISLTSKGGIFFGMMDEQSKTFNGRMSTLKDAVNNTLMAFAQPINAALLPQIEKLTKYVEALAPKFEALSLRVISGFSGASMKAAFESTANYSAVVLSESFKKAVEVLGVALRALFSPEGMGFLKSALLDVFFAAFNAIGEASYELGKTIAAALKGEVTMKDKTRVYGTPKEQEESAKGFAARLSEAIGGVDFAPSDRLKDATKKWQSEMGKIFPKVAGDGASGQASVAGDYEKEYAAQRARVAQETAKVEMFGPSKSLMMPRGPMDGLSAAQDRYASIGSNNAFGSKRPGLGISSGLITGGLGEKRRLGASRDEKDAKKNLSLQERQVGSLENIERNISQSLSVN